MRRAARAAAQEAVHLFAYDEAVTILRRALAAGVPDKLRAEVLIDLGDAQWWADDHAGAYGTFREAEALAARSGNARVQALAALGATRPRPNATTVLSDTANVPLLQRALDALGDDEVDLRLRLSGALALHSTDDRARARITCATRWRSPTGRRTGRPLPRRSTPRASRCGHP